MLSIIAPSFTLAGIKKLGLEPTVSKDLFIRARSHAKAFGAGADQFEDAKKRSVGVSRDSIKKALLHLEDPQFLEQTAYGIKDLDLGDGKTISIPAQARKMAAQELWLRYYRAESATDLNGKVIKGTYNGGLSRADYLRVCSQRPKGSTKTACAVDDTLERHGNDAVRLVREIATRFVVSGNSSV